MTIVKATDAVTEMLRAIFFMNPHLECTHIEENGPTCRICDAELECQHTFCFADRCRNCDADLTEKETK